MRTPLEAKPRSSGMKGGDIEVALEKHYRPEPCGTPITATRTSCGSCALTLNAKVCGVLRMAGASIWCMHPIQKIGPQTSMTPLDCLSKQDLRGRD